MTNARVANIPLRAFSWPQLEQFNWARDYFDVIAAGNDRPALWVVDDAGADQSVSFAQLARRSSQLANFLTAMGIERGDRILVMLGNIVPLWETILAAIKLGAVIIPATTLLGPEDLADRISRGCVKAVITHAHLAERLDEAGKVEVRIAVGAEVPGWRDYARSHDADERPAPRSRTRSDDPLFLYFTSGTTSRPKLVVHTHVSYPVGHLSTMYWLGLRPGDVHLNLSSPGWAKHAWS